MAIDAIAVAAKWDGRRALVALKSAAEASVHDLRRALAEADQGRIAEYRTQKEARIRRQIAAQARR